MSDEPMSVRIKERVQHAARSLGTADPLQYVGPLIERSFELPAGDATYAANTLTPGAVPFEPSFSEREPDVLRFTMEPLGPGHSPGSRREEATREMRRLVGPTFGRPALKWLDCATEDFRGMSSMSQMYFGAWFGTAYDRDGLSASKVYYELGPGQLDALSPSLRRLVQSAIDVMPGLVPVFTSIACRRDCGVQRVTFVVRDRLALNDLAPVMQQLGLGHQLPSLMQVVGLVLGGRFELPAQSILVGLAETPDGPELRLEIMLGTLPDVPEGFLDLLALGLSERPRQLRALVRWLHAFTPEEHAGPGRFSVLSVRTTPLTPARVSLYLRPVEFELRGRLEGAGAPVAA